MSAIITYGNKISETISGGEAIELECSGCKMTSNVIVECTDEPAQDDGSYDEGYAAGYDKCTSDMQDDLEAKYTEGYNKCTEDMADTLQEKFDEGVADGKKEEHDAFWDAYQENGNRGDHQYAFYGTGWNDVTFKPKHDIVPTNANRLFFGSKITNLVQILKDRGVTLDLSKCPSANATFCLSTSSITHFPSIPISAISTISGTSSSIIKSAKSLRVLGGLHGLTYWAYGSSADGEEFYSGGTTIPNDLFQNLESLEEILSFEAEEPTFSGELYHTCGIFTGTVNLSWSPNLSRETLLRVADTLASERDFSDDWNFIIGEANMAKLTDEEITAITEKGWVVS